MRYEIRLRRLEARMRARPHPPYALIDALQRAVREKLTRRLEGMDDTPEQAAQHAALRNQWRELSNVGTAVGARA